MQKKAKREIIEWAILITVGGALYFTGYHTEVIGQLQRGLLATGLMQPDLDQDKQQLPNYALNLKFKNREGKILTLRDFANKPVFLNFWATWCPPCIAEMPDIENLYMDMHQEAHFILISVDQEASKAWEFQDRKAFAFPVYTIEGGIPPTFAYEAIPTTFVLNRKNEIVLRREGMAKYNSESFRKFLTDLSRQ